MTNPDILNDKTAYFISISGNTLDNILAARIAKKKDVRTVAITRDPRSKLARLCDDLIELKYRYYGHNYVWFDRIWCFSPRMSFAC